MAKASRFIGGKYITKEMVESMSAKEREVVIDHVAEESITGTPKLVCYFDKHELGLPLNTTRIEQLMDIHGGVEETDEWRGTKVRLVVDPNVRFQGKRVGGVAIEGAEK